MFSQVNIVCIFITFCLGYAFIYKTQGSVDSKSLMGLIIMSILISFLFCDYRDTSSSIKIENMSDLVYNDFDFANNKQCYGLYNLPKRKHFDNIKSDYVSSGLKFNNDAPFYADATSHGECNGNAPYELIDDAIEISVEDDLKNQHNNNIVWSPHTHYGKNRSYMNWKSTNNMATI